MLNIAITPNNLILGREHNEEDDDNICLPPRKRRNGQRSIPNLPYSQGPSDEIGIVQASMASFEEWLLQNAVLKHVTVDGLATFQLQFTWNSCANHKRKDFAAGNRPNKSLVNLIIRSL